jgi:hypothetical protein
MLKNKPILLSGFLACPLLLEGQMKGVIKERSNYAPEYPDR